MLDEYRKLFTEKTRLVAVTQVSNVLGTVNPVKEIIAIAHEQGVPVLVDGAQSTPHMKVDVQDLDAEFFVFSGHKIYGPTGIGVLYGKEEWLDKLPPYQGGGEMIATVSFEKTVFNELPLSSRPVRLIILVVQLWQKLCIMWKRLVWIGLQHKNKIYWNMLPLS